MLLLMMERILEDGVSTGKTFPSVVSRLISMSNPIVTQNKSQIYLLQVWWVWKEKLVWFWLIKTLKNAIVLKVSKNQSEKTKDPNKREKILEFKLQFKLKRKRVNKVNLRLWNVLAWRLLVKLLCKNKYKIWKNSSKHTNKNARNYKLNCRTVHRRSLYLLHPREQLRHHKLGLVQARCTSWSAQTVPKWSVWEEQRTTARGAVLICAFVSKTDIYEFKYKQ